MSVTNETTRKILNFLFSEGIFAWRQNVTGIPTSHGWRAAPKTGISDILAVMPPSGRLLAVEVKTGKDRLRPEQIGFKRNIELMGGIYLVVKDFQDFERQFNDL